jgi:outer membrane receptor protein involved in Fe transport
MSITFHDQPSRRGRPVPRLARGAHSTLLVAGLLCASLATADPGELGEVVVTASFRPATELDLPGSVAVLDAATLRAAGEQHLEDVLALVPNLNWAGDTARPRYFQVRGIGELLQYQGAPNPSIGFLIDDIDFSGLGAAATLFDIDQIEVLRGPQGARYGANALGGLIYATSAAPSADYGGRVEVGIGDYNTQSYGAVVSGPVTTLDSGFRLAVQRYTSDGYYSDDYLHRSTTAGFDELTLRGRWRYQPSDALRIDLTVMHTLIDDGYDDFSVNNTRTTESDQPGVDSQHSTGVALRAEATLAPALRLTTIASYANSPIKYSYDGDWGNPAFWAPYVYQSYEVQSRDRNTRNVELRLAGGERTGWIVGVYRLELHETLDDAIYNLYQDPLAQYTPPASLTVTDSDYLARSTALFAALDQPIGSALTLSAGLRAERRDVSYHDTLASTGIPTLARAFGPTDQLWGGNLSLTWSPSPATRIYALVARGYKAGGFNLSAGLPTGELYFSPESDLNFELGYKADLPAARVRAEADVFYTRRHALQLLTGTQLQPDNPSSFVYYTGNATSGYNTGLESNLAWQASSRWQFGVSLGLLETRYHGFVQNGIELPDRALPHAPPWQGAVNATWRDPRGYFARADVTGMGGFYFDMPPNPTASRPYGLLNLRVGLERNGWSASLWGRNLLNKDYAVRGFYFGDQPPNFPNQEYLQLGPPRTFGIGLTRRF